MSTPYAYADKQLAGLKKYVSAMFHNAANEMAFDELNVRQAKDFAKRLYAKLESRNEEMLRSIVEEAYKAGFAEASEEEDDFSGLLETAIVLSLMARYHGVTHYSYNQEVKRKRDRLMEGLLSVDNRHDAQEILNRAAKLWFNQSRQYADFAVDDARTRAFENAGVEYVKWVAEKDDRTCHTCKDLDGQVFAIDAMPEIPQHHHCRCWVVPVLDGQMTV